MKFVEIIKILEPYMGKWILLKARTSENTFIYEGWLLDFEADSEFVVISSLLGIHRIDATFIDEVYNCLINHRRYGR